MTTCPLSRALLKNSDHPWCNGASKQIQVVILWTLCSLLAFRKYAVKIPSSKSDAEFTLPNMRAGSDTPRGFILCNLWECIGEPVFLCLMREHSLRVSTSPEIQDDLPVPGGPATIIPRKKMNEWNSVNSMCAEGHTIFTRYLRKWTLGTYPILRQLCGKLETVYCTKMSAFVGHPKLIIYYFWWFILLSRRLFLAFTRQRLSARSTTTFCLLIP